MLDILYYPDPRLRRIAQPVVEFDDEIRQIADQMTQTMYASNGIGLASIQVGIEKSIIVVDVDPGQNNPMVLINPEIINSTGEQIVEEGCLSFPGYFAQVKRAEVIQVRKQSPDGELEECEAQGLLAVCIQHEIDHLNGKLFTDYLSRLRQQRVKKKFTKVARARRREMAQVS